MVKRNFISALILIIITITFLSCESSSTLTQSSITRNSKASLEKPYVILVSLDGFRWDYIEKYQPPHISNFVNNGVKAESLVPSFPSKTFPNHYTIATGMFPDKHGIVGNSFYSHKKDKIYKLGNRETVEDGSFYGGNPIWIQADKASMVSASYFFVGSEADIQGLYPTYYHRYDGSVKNEVRVAAALKWLELPEKQRPHIITMYFSDMDDVGHRFGPNNDVELKKTLLNLDDNLGELFDGVAASDLPVNIILVSDHGMSELSTSNYIAIEDIRNDQLFTVINNGAIVNLYPKEGVDTESIMQYLKPKENNFKVYKTENAPGFEYSPLNKDWGVVQIIPDFGYYFSTRQRIDNVINNNVTTVGVHGYDQKHKDMHGIFYANGPAFKQEYTIQSLKNIHIYPLICNILGLQIPNDIDGDLNQIKDVLKN